MEPACLNSNCYEHRKIKRILNKSYKFYRNNLQRSIKASRSSNPREYWKLMNDKSSNEYNDINIVDLYDYFKAVNPNEHDLDPSMVDAKIHFVTH